MDAPGRGRGVRPRAPRLGSDAGLADTVDGARRRARDARHRMARGRSRAARSRRARAGRARRPSITRSWGPSAVAERRVVRHAGSRSRDLAAGRAHPRSGLGFVPRSGSGPCPPRVPRPRTGRPHGHAQDRPQSDDPRLVRRRAGPARRVAGRGRDTPLLDLGQRERGGAEGSPGRPGPAGRGAPRSRRRRFRRGAPPQGHPGAAPAPDADAPGSVLQRVHPGDPVRPADRGPVDRRRVPPEGGGPAPGSPPRRRFAARRRARARFPRVRAEPPARRLGRERRDGPRPGAGGDHAAAAPSMAEVRRGLRRRGVLHDPDRCGAVGAPCGGDGLSRAGRDAARAGRAPPPRSSRPPCSACSSSTRGSSGRWGSN